MTPNQVTQMVDDLQVKMASEDAVKWLATCVSKLRRKADEIERYREDVEVTLAARHGRLATEKMASAVTELQHLPQALCLDHAVTLAGRLGAVRPKEIDR